LAYRISPKEFLFAITAILIGIVLYLVSIYSYILFHSVVEEFSILVAFGVFIIGWHSIKYTENRAFLLLGVAFLFIGWIDFFHTLAYKGMGVFPGISSNPPTQLWIAARYLESITLLFAPLAAHRRIGRVYLVALYLVITGFLLFTILVWPIFPVCYIEGVGLTPFKIVSEYIISAILVMSGYMFYRRRSEFDPSSMRLLVTALCFTIASELAFTLYTDVYGLANLLGHYLKVIAFCFIYQALVQASLVRPYDTLFMNLKRSRDEVEERERDLRETHEQLVRSEKLATLGKMSGSVAHELRNPLGAIKNAAYFLNMFLKSPDPDVKESIDIISKEVGNSERIISSLLDYARPKPLNKQKALISDIVKNAIAAIDLPQTITTRVELDSSAPYVLGDIHQLKRVFINLITNALQAMPNGGEIVISSQANESSSLSVSISDTGIGISEENMRHIFEPLYSTRAKGIGLGLVIVKSIVEAHSGTVEVTSKKDEGSKFTIRLPISERGGNHQ
jgi:signal transduction histidine kinase